MKFKMLPYSIVWPLILLTLVVLIMIAFLNLSSCISKHETALQIRIESENLGRSLPDGFYVYRGLNQRGIHIKSIIPEKHSLIVKFDSGEQRKLAEGALRDILPTGYLIK